MTRQPETDNMSFLTLTTGKETPFLQQLKLKFREFWEYFQLFLKSGIGPKQVPNIAIFTGSILVSNLGRSKKSFKQVLGQTQIRSVLGQKTLTLQFEKTPSTDNLNLITNFLIVLIAGKHNCSGTCAENFVYYGQQSSHELKFVHHQLLTLAYVNSIILLTII